MSCRGQSKRKQVACYTHKAARRVKSGVMWVGRQSGKQGTQHQYAWGLFLIAALGFTFMVGKTLLVAPINNPTASQVTYTTTWMNNGTLVEPGQSISGPLNVSVQPSASALTETPTWRVGALTPQVLTPYAIAGMVLKVYSGSSASGTPVWSLPLMVNSSTYVATVQAWASAYFTSIEQNLGTPSKWVLGATPTANPAWLGSFDTRFLQNGVYTFQVAVTWAMPASRSIASIPPPPSLSSTSGNAYLLSTFGIGVTIPEESLIGLVVFFAVAGVGVAVALMVVRRRLK